MNKKRNPQDKARIVMAFINTSIPATELCRKHNISSIAFQDWKDKFMQAGPHKQKRQDQKSHKEGRESQAYNR